MQPAEFKTSYPQDMVFYYLTPMQFGRYSSSNLCPALSSPGRFRNQRTGGGIWLVNPCDDGRSPISMADLRRSFYACRLSLASIAIQKVSARLTCPPEVKHLYDSQQICSALPRSASCSN